MFNFLKRLLPKKNLIPEEKYGCQANFLYQDENVKTIYKLLNNDYGWFNETNDDFNAMARQISLIKHRVPFDVDALSTVIIEVETGIECFKDVIEVLANTKMTVIQRIENNTIKLLFSGSIRDYKYLIKTTKNQSNYIVQGIIEQLYNCNACYFDDLIEDEIMEPRFSSTDISWRSINKQESDIATYDDRNYIYNLISKYNFTYQDAVKCCYVSLLNQSVPSKCTRYSCLELSKLYHEGFIELDAADELLKKVIIVQDEVYQELFTPEYKKFENNNDFYKDIDEVISEDIEEIKDIKQEEEMPVIKETEDGDLEYDPTQFE